MADASTPSRGPVPGKMVATLYVKDGVESGAYADRMALKGIVSPKVIFRCLRHPLHFAAFSLGSKRRRRKALEKVGGRATLSYSPSVNLV